MGAGGAGRAHGLGEARLGAEDGGLVGVLPGETGLVAAEVAVGGGLAVDRAPQVQRLHQGGRAQVEVVTDQAGDRGPVIFSVPKVSMSRDSGRATPIA